MKNIHQKIFEIQQALGVIPKNKENPHFKSRYADYPSIIEKLKPLLRQHKLSTTINFRTCNGMESIPDDSVIVTLTIRNIEAEDEFVKSELTIPFAKNNPMAVGSGITFAKRYLICAAFNIVVDDEDDDGVAASKVRGRRPQASDKASGSNDPLEGLI